MGQLEAIRPRPIMRHQQPTGTALVSGMQPIARYRLRYLRDEVADISEEQALSGISAHSGQQGSHRQTGGRPSTWTSTRSLAASPPSNASKPTNPSGPTVAVSAAAVPMTAMRQMTPAWGKYAYRRRAPGLASTVRGFNDTTSSDGASRASSRSDIAARSRLARCCSIWVMPDPCRCRHRQPSCGGRIAALAQPTAP